MENPWVNLANHSESMLDITNWPHLHDSRPQSLGSFSENSSDQSSSNSSQSSRSTSCSRKEKELDKLVLERRQKQIDYGKNLLDYDKYVSKVPKNQRSSLNIPRTPNKNVKYSRRQWDGLIKKWKIQIHSLNPENDVLENNDDDVFIKENSNNLPVKEKYPKSTYLASFDQKNVGNKVSIVRIVNYLKKVCKFEVLKINNSF